MRRNANLGRARESYCLPHVTALGLSHCFCPIENVLEARGLWLTCPACAQVRVALKRHTQRGEALP